MTRLMLLAGAALSLAAPALVAPGAAHAETACADLTQAKVAHAEVTSAKLEPIKGGQACHIALHAHPTADSDIRIEVMIPVAGAWNGKYVQVGNGGLAGSVPEAAIKLRADSGFAAAGTDDGHAGNGRTAVWALHHPEKVVDFGWRSLKETTEASRQLIVAMKGEPAKRRYFVGCSLGGREALIEAQRFPRDFDGIVAGATANYNTLGYGGRAYMQQVLAKPGGYLGSEQLQLLQDAALKQCAGGGTFIRDQAACHFDPASLKCKAGQAPDSARGGCLTAPQVASAKAIYGGRVVGGKSVFPGYEPGAEAVRGGWQAWNTGTEQSKWTESAGHAMGSQFMKYLVYDDPAFDFLKMDTGAKYDRDRQKLSKIMDAMDVDLTPFASHGGKLIQYHGWNDPAIAPRGSIRYHDAVEAKTPKADGFYRLYMIPGMLHCQGGNGPNTVDWLGLLDRWVEAGEVPKQVTASSPSGETQMLCPYPGVARKSGEAYACSTGKKKG
jgi:feruloyl esterase